MPFNNMLSTGPANAPRTAYGSVPGPIGVPPNIFSQLSGAIPGFGRSTTGTSGVINSELAGTVSPGTLNALKTGAAQFGIGSGMGPGSGLETNQLFGNIAGFSEAQSHRGVQDYLSEIGALGPTMTNPNLAAEISSRNAAFAAAPDPRLAAEQAFNDWLRGFNATQGAAGYGNVGRWPGGGTLGPAQGFGTTHSNYGGLGGLPPDSLGFPGYDMSSQQGYGTVTATATPPPGGWTEPAPYGTGYATSPFTGHGFNNLFPGADSGAYQDPSYGPYQGYTGG